MSKTIFTKNAPPVVGPYSQGIQVGNLLFCAGQIGVNPQTTEMPQSAVNQAKQALENLKAVLTEAGFSLNDVVRAEIFMTNLDDYKDINEVYDSYFLEQKPARQAVAVAALPRAAKVEISFIAAKGE